MRRSTVFRMSRVRMLSAGLIFVVVVTGCSTSPSGTSGEQRSALSGLSIGVVDTEWLLKESKLGRQVSETLETFMQNRQALLELEQQELRRLENQLLRQGSVLSPSARQQKEEDFRRRMVAYQQKAGDMNREVQAKRVESLDEFRDRVDVIVKRIALDQGMALVIEKGQKTSTRYYEPSLDLSPAVKEALDRETSTAGQS